MVIKKVQEMVALLLLVADDLARKLRVDEECLLSGDLNMLITAVQLPGSLAYWMCPD
jgi:hypothetical protein